MSKTSTVDQLIKWRREFEITSRQSSAHHCLSSPTHSLTSSEYELQGEAYSLDVDTDPLFNEPDSPKEQLVRSSTMTGADNINNTCGGGSLLHSLVLANSVTKVRSLLRLLLREDTTTMTTTMTATTTRGRGRGRPRDEEQKREREEEELVVVEEEESHQELLQLLSATDATGATPLFLCKSAVMTDLLLTAGSNPNHQNNVGLTALHRSALFARVDVVCRLLEGGARADACDDRGRSALDVVDSRLEKPQHKTNRRLRAVAYLLQASNGEGEKKGDESGGCCVVA